MHKMPIILHPAHRAVLTDNPVFHIIQVFSAVRNLGVNACLHLIDILRMNKPFKRVARQLLKLLQRAAAKNTQHGMIDINQFLIPVGMVNKKAAGHPFRNLLNDGQRAFVKTDCKLWLVSVCFHRLASQNDYTI